MEYRKIGASDLEVSVVTFGAWAAGGWMWGGTVRKATQNAKALHVKLPPDEVSFITEELNKLELIKQ